MCRGLLWHNGVFVSLAVMYFSSPWFSPQQSAVIPSRIKQRLLYKGSLTAQLKKQSQGNFAVRCLYQGWQVPRFDERKVLQMREREVALIREVFFVLMISRGFMRVA